MHDEPLTSAVPAAEAIPRLLEEHGGKIYGLGLRLCGSPDEAEDLVQETFLQAFRSWNEFEGRSQPSTWLYTIASHLCQRLHRKRSGEPAHMESLEELLPGPGAVVPQPPNGDDPEHEQIRREAEERLERAIVELPDEFRLPLILKDLLELPVARVAEALGVKEATVKTRLHRARLKLRQVLAEGLPAPASPQEPRHPSVHMCLDLLQAKQEALDRGVELAVPGEEICARCRAVFRTMDLARDICRQITAGDLPEDVRRMLLDRLEAA